MLAPREADGRRRLLGAACTVRCAAKGFHLHPQLACKTNVPPSPDNQAGRGARCLFARLPTAGLGLEVRTLVEGLSHFGRESVN